jgi:hypothetical protein
LKTETRSAATAPTIEGLAALIRCDADAGLLFWRERPREMFPTGRAHSIWNARYAGKQAFTAKDRDGYFQGSFLGQRLRTHRVVWALTHGEWPDVVDHIDGDRANNRISNLRNVSKAENARNMGMRDGSTSGRIGVCWIASRQRWQASVMRDGRVVNLGRFRELQDAVAARQQAERDIGFHPNHGRAK